MNFRNALGYLELEHRIARKEMPEGSFVVMMPALHLPSHATQAAGPKVNDRTAKHIGVNTPLHSQPYLAYFNGETLEWQPGWLPSQADLFSNDWLVRADEEEEATE